MHLLAINLIANKINQRLLADLYPFQMGGAVVGTSRSRRDRRGAKQIVIPVEGL